MDGHSNAATEGPSREKRGAWSENGPAKVSRRDLLKLSMCGGAGLAVDGLVDLPAARAATRELKLSDVSEFTTACNFCSCGCGMIAAVRDGKLVSLEGDYDHIVNRGSLCVKGMAMFPTHTSPRRNKVPRYRAPGSDTWVDITWQEASRARREEDQDRSRRDLDLDGEGRGRGSAREPDGRHRVPGRRAEHERGVLPLPEGVPSARERVRRAPGEACDTVPPSPVWGPPSVAGP